MIKDVNIRKSAECTRGIQERKKEEDEMSIRCF